MRPEKEESISSGQPIGESQPAEPEAKTGSQWQLPAKQVVLSFLCFPPKHLSVHTFRNWMRKIAIAEARTVGSDKSGFLRKAGALAVSLNNHVWIHCLGNNEGVA